MKTSFRTANHLKATLENRKAEIEKQLIVFELSIQITEF